MLVQVWANGDTVLVVDDGNLNGTQGVSYCKPGDSFEWQAGIGVALLRMEMDIQLERPDGLAYFGMIRVDEDGLADCADALRGRTDGAALELMALGCVEYTWEEYK